MKNTLLLLLATGSLCLASCTTSNTQGGAGRSYSEDHSAGGWFGRSPEEDWQDQTFRRGGY